MGTSAGKNDIFLQGKPPSHSGTAVGTIDAVGRQKALACGANVIMPNGTPKEFRRHDQIYPNKICIEESPQNCRFCIEGMVSSLGRRIGQDYGHTLKKCPAGVL